MIRIELDELTKHFGGNTVIDKLELTVEPGEILALLGPSGCGKTTTLKLIAGLLHPDHGDIKFDGSSVLDIPAEKRSAVLVFQEYMLFPHLTVEGNISFGMKMMGKSSNVRKRRVKELLKLIELEGYEDYRPHQLSGGEKQRVALARAAAVNTDVLLLDEPLSNLDTALREEMQHFIRNIHDCEEMTTIFVTHDRDEAMLMADRIAVMKNGKIIQCGSPEKIYKYPVNRFTADFLGPANYIDGYLEDSRLYIGNNELEICLENISSSLDYKCEGEVIILLRPEFVSIHRKGEISKKEWIEGVIVSRKFVGDRIKYKVDLGQHQFLTVACLSPSEFSEGDYIFLEIDNDNIWIIEKK